jgi:Zn-dependent peptidase ImmA (M78 family)
MASFQKISKLSLDLLLKHQLLEEEVDLSKLIQAYDIEVFYAKAPHIGISGALLQKQKAKPRILINSDHSETRQRFTLAHELGHYFLHKDGGDFIDGDKTKILLRAETENARASSMEKEANHFAASLLMPAVLIKQAWESLEGEGGAEGKTEILSQWFKVSLRAMQFRLMNLGYIDVV